MSMLSLLLGGADTDLGFGLLPPAGDQARSGDSVALSDDSTTLPLTAAIGAPGYVDGAVHIYQFDGTTYNFFTTISSPSPNIDFGFSVALNGDGTVLAIGAPDELGEGRVHTYLWNGTTYIADQILDSGFGTAERLGDSVFLSKVGDSLSASVPLGEANNSGWAFSWFKSGTWMQVNQRIGVPGADPNSNCSESMGMSADGLTVVLMQPGSAEVRIFERVSISASFSEVFTLTVATIGGLSAVTIEDGAQLVFLTDPPSGASTGGVRTFVNQGGGSWTAGSFVAAPGTAGSDFGNVIVARNNVFFVDDGAFPNLVHEFTYSNDGLTLVFVSSMLPPDSNVGTQYGNSLALVFPTATRHLAIGEPNRARLGFLGAGNAYVILT